MTFIMRNAMDAQEIAVGWWPGDPRYGQAAFYAYAHPAPEGFPAAPVPARSGPLEPRSGRVHIPTGTTSEHARATVGRPGVRPFRLPPRVRGLRRGLRSPGQYRRKTAARGLGPLLARGRLRDPSGLSATAACDDRCARPRVRGDCLGPPRGPKVVDEDNSEKGRPEA